MQPQKQYVCKTNLQEGTQSNLAASHTERTQSWEPRSFTLTHIGGQDPNQAWP